MEIEKMINEIVASLDDLVNDTSVPRNIRRGAKEASTKWLMNTSKPFDVRIFTVINILEELADDPNIPMHARTQIYGIISNLESVNQMQKDKK